MSELDPGRGPPAAVSRVVIPAKRAALGPVDAALITVTLVWGFNSVAVKYALSQFLPLSFNAVRFIVASTLVFAVLRVSEGKITVPRRDLPLLLGIGLLGNTLYQIGFIKGLALTTAGNVSFVLATMPATIAMLSHILRVDRLGPRGWLGFAITLSGTLLIITSGAGMSFHGETVRGDLICLAGTLGFSLYTVLSKRLLGRYSPLQLTAWTMGLGTLGLIAVSLPELVRQDWTAPEPLSWASLIGSAALALVFAYVAWNWGLRQLGTARTAVYANLSPLWTGLFGWLLLHETWTLLRVAGAGLILFGVGMVRSSRATRAAPACEMERDT